MAAFHWLKGRGDLAEVDRLLYRGARYASDHLPRAVTAYLTRCAVGPPHRIIAVPPAPPAPAHVWTAYAGTPSATSPHCCGQSADTTFLLA